MAEYIDCRNCDSPNCKGCNIYTLATMLNAGKFDCLMNANRSINPTADVVEVRHGRWETETDYDEFWGELDYYKCSLCGNLELRDKQTPYCPNCGARMDGDG